MVLLQLRRKQHQRLGHLLKGLFVQKVMQEIANLMVEMVMLDLRSAAMMEGTRFKWLINYLEPSIEFSWLLTLPTA